MLFDLRSRGRRRTVQAVYLGLAVLMAGGLVLFGVGAGNGFGGLLGDFKNESTAWEAVATASPNEPKGYECLAASAYAAGLTRLGDLAAGKAITLVPKGQQTLLKSQLTQAKTQPQVAQSC